MNNKLITVKETAAYLNLTPITVYEYIRTGQLSAVKFGRYYRIDRKDLDQFINKHKTYLKIL